MQIQRKHLELMTWPGGFWVRVPTGGPGLWASTYAGHPEVFSERHGYVKRFRLGDWARWSWLGTYKPPPPPNQAQRDFIRSVLNELERSAPKGPIHLRD